MTITYVNTIEAKEEFSELLNLVTQKHHTFVLTRRGKEIAALIPYEDFKLLQKSLNKSDLDEAVEAFKEARREGTVTLEQIKVKIGQNK